MKNKLIRGLTWVLILALVLSLVSGLFVMGNAASVTYQTGSVSGFSNVILNWGSRGTTATFLSPNAEDFYAENNITYDQLSALSGGTAANAYSSELYEALQDLMADNHTTITSYEDTKELYRFTDCQNNQNTALNSISSFYSGMGIGPGWGQGNTWNREHTWPNSKGLEGSDEDDIMMLRPTSGSENSSRGNKAYGESSGYYDPNGESNGQYNLHGDVARIMLYVYVRWGNRNLWGAAGVMENLDVMLRWMEEDPVDTWELGRNDSVESITGTRNVFVDYPELAFVLFQQAVPGDMITPSGEASDCPYTITATSNNTAYGTVSVSGKVINAYPAAGYEATGYTVVSGTASAIQNGNTFTVTAESDCQIRILFAPRSAHEIRFMESGKLGSTATAYRGDEITFPAHTTQIAEGFTFLGWITENLEETTDRPETIHAPGATYKVANATTFYALYSRFDSEAGGGGLFEKHTGALTPGNYLITYEGGALQAAPGSNGRLAYQDITVAGNTVQNPDETLIFRIDNTADGYVTLFNAASNRYIAGTGEKNKGTLLSSVTDFAKFSVTGSSTYEFKNLGNKNKGVNHTLRKNGTYGFALYSDSTTHPVGGPLTLFKEISGTIYYSTGECNHNWSDWTKTDDNNHSRSCDQCDETETKAHSYSGGVLNPDGQTITFACPDCAHARQVEISAMIPGDFNGDLTVTNEDVIYLLWHTLFPEMYPIFTNADFVHDDAITNEDVIYLLWHTLFPEDYPLN